MTYRETEKVTWNSDGEIQSELMEPALDWWHWTPLAFVVPFDFCF